MKKSLYALLPLALGACAAPDAIAPAAPSAAVARLAPVTLDTARLGRLADGMNRSLAASGRSLRVAQMSFFTLGRGVPSYRRLRFGAWVDRTPEVVFDASDYTTQIAPEEVDAAMERAYASWNRVARGGIVVRRAADDMPNPDLFDVPVYDDEGTCVSLFDDGATPLQTGSLAGDIVVGGWLPAQFFSECLGNSSVIGLTLTLVATDGTGAYVDGDGDGYADIQYAEQYYNDSFQWVTAYAQFLGPDADLESILVHENGHAIGLDHFGRLNLQPPIEVLLKRGNLFDPAAVMNEGYAGGENRTPLPTDVAAVRTLYNSGR